MAEYIVATDNTERLERELFAGILSAVALDLTLSNGNGSKHVWFLPDDVSRIPGSEDDETKHEIRYLGQAWESENKDDVHPDDVSPAYVESEGSMLVFHTDEI